MSSQVQPGMQFTNRPLEGSSGSLKRCLYFGRSDTDLSPGFAFWTKRGIYQPCSLSGVLTLSRLTFLLLRAASY